MKMLKTVMGLAIGFATSIAVASNTDAVMAIRDARGVDVRQGYFHADLNKARQFAEENGFPLLAIWSNGDYCAHCLAMEGALASSVFVDWMKTSGIVYYIGFCEDGPHNYNGGTGPTSDGQEGYHGTSFYWCRNGNAGASFNFPYVRIYWPAGGLDQIYTGATLVGEGVLQSAFPCSKTDDSILLMSEEIRNKNFLEVGDKGTYNPAGRYLINFLTNPSTGVLRNWKPVPVSKYHGGVLNFSTRRNAGPQIEIKANGDLKTTNVTVSVERTDAEYLKHSYTNYLVRTYPNGQTKTDMIKWAPNETVKTVDVFVNQSRVGAYAGKSVKLILTDDKMEGVSTNKIWIMQEVEGTAEEDYQLENGPKNPRWIGERTEETLDWGEWTMDLDVLTNKVVKANQTGGSRAYSMVLVAGGLWCPDCAATDKYLFSRPEFRAWAKKRHVALGVVDIPKFPNTTTSPSLLSSYVFTTSDAYVTYRSTTAADEGQRIQSGTPYLTRNMISSSAAKKVFDRNAKLVGTSTMKGGWNTPARAAVESTKDRTPVPILLVLRDDGSIAARWNMFAELGARSYNANYLIRLDELLAQVDAQEEEKNDYWQSTQDSVVKRGVLSGRTLSAADLVDTYKIDSASAGQKLSFEVSSADDVQARVEIISVSGGVEAKQPLASVVGSLAGNGLNIGAKVTENCYLRIKVDTGSSSFTPKLGTLQQAESGSSTVSSYKIVSSNVLSPQETEQVAVVATNDALYAEHSVAMDLIQGQTYKITNLDETRIEGVFNKGTGENSWVAMTNGVVSLALKDKGEDGSYRVSYLLWRTGMIGFDTVSARVSEPSGVGAFTDYKVKVVRTGGASGTAQATLKVDWEKSSLPETAKADQSVFVWKDAEGIALPWASESGVTYKWEAGEATTNEIVVRVVANEYADGDQMLCFTLTQEAGVSDAGLHAGYSSMVLTAVDDDMPNSGILAISGTDPAMSQNMKVLTRAGGDVSVSVGRFNGADGCVTGVLSSTAGVLTNFVWQGRSAEVQQYTIAAPEKAEETLKLTLSALGGARVDVNRKYLVIQSVDGDAPEFEEAVVDVRAAKGVAFPETSIVAVKSSSLKSAGEEIVVKCSGSLAPGLSWRYADGAIGFVGTPTKAGVYTVVFQVKEGGVSGLTTMVTVTVDDPAIAVTDEEGVEVTPANEVIAKSRTYSDILVVDVTQNRLVGLLTITVPSSGRVSAKYRSMFGLTLPMMSTEWSDYDRVTGTLTAQLRGIDEEQPSCTAMVRVGNNGVSVEFADPSEMFAGDTFTNIVNASEWVTSAEKWAGYYTVSMPQTNVVSPVAPIAKGDAFVTLRMTAYSANISAKMAYAGMLPNGRAFSGAAQLRPDAGGGFALLPLVNAVSGADSLVGIFKIEPAYTETVVRSVYSMDETFFHWIHQEESEKIAYEVQLDAFGSVYDRNANICSSCSDAFGTELENLKFWVQSGVPETEPYSSYGTPYVWNTEKTGVKVEMANGVNQISLRKFNTVKVTNGLTLNFNEGLGTVNGVLRLDFDNGNGATNSVNAAWKGVVMPGWGNSCSDCKDDSDLLLRPFISGSAWFNDTVIDPERGTSIKIRRGYSISVGVGDGK